MAASARLERIALADLSERYAFLDPASGKVPANHGQKVTRLSARQAIWVVAPDDLGRIFGLHCWADRVPTNELVEKIYEIQDTWHPVAFGCEANAMQALFADMLALDARLKGKTLPLVPVHQPTRVDKDFRIRGQLHPLVGNGKLLLSATLDQVLLEEITGFPATQLRDVIDALGSACAMVPPRRSVRQSQAVARRRSSYAREMEQRWGGQDFRQGQGERPWLENGA